MNDLRTASQVALRALELRRNNGNRAYDEQADKAISDLRAALGLPVAHMADRFIVIAWPKEHEEELSDYARDIESMLHMAGSGGAVVIYPLDSNVDAAIEQHHQEELP